MKKIILGVALMLSLATFAQKDELKTLKKIYSKNSISESDLKDYKSAYESLGSMQLNEDDNIYFTFYKTMYPTVILASKGDKATMQDQMNIYNPKFIEEYGAVIVNTLAYESKSGKKVYTNDLIEEKKQFSATLSQFANALNQESKFKEASLMFYNLYLFDKEKEGGALENAAILSVQAEDYKTAEKLYAEYLESDYFKNGVKYFAVNKANDTEDFFGSKKERIKYISLKTHEKPRDEKVSDSKKEIVKILAILTIQNGNIQKGKQLISEAIKLNPNDKELLTREFTLYFNEGYEYLKEDDKLVGEINASVDNQTKYDELMGRRRAMFRRALPSFEKAYQINSTDNNTKILLKTCYDILGMKDKAATIK